MAGICAGRRGALKRGSVILAKRVFDYERGKVIRTYDRKTGDLLDEHFLPDGARHDVCPAWDLAIDALCGNWSTRSGKFRVVKGVIGSGSRVVMDEKIFSYVCGLDRDTVGIDREAAAIGEVARGMGITHWIVAKGVQDHADLTKSDAFRKRAARRSAEVLFAFLKAELPRVLGASGAESERLAPAPSRALPYRPATAPSLTGEPKVEGLREVKAFLKRRFSEDPILVASLIAGGPRDKETRPRQWGDWVDRATASDLLENLRHIRYYERDPSQRKLVAQLLPAT